MNIENIIYSEEMGAACLTIAMFPYISEQIAKERGLSDLGDIAVVLYLDLLDRFSRSASAIFAKRRVAARRFVLYIPDKCCHRYT